MSEMSDMGLNMLNGAVNTLILAQADGYEFTQEDKLKIRAGMVKILMLCTDLDPVVLDAMPKLIKQMKADRQAKEPTTQKRRKTA